MYNFIDHNLVVLMRISGLILHPHSYVRTHVLDDIVIKHKNGMPTNMCIIIVMRDGRENMNSNKLFGINASLPSAKLLYTTPPSFI